MFSAAAERSVGDVWEQLRRAARSAAAILFPLLCVFLGLRRICGGFVQPLPGGWLVLVGVLAAAAASVLRHGHFEPVRDGFPRSTAWTVAAIPSLALLVLGVSLSLPRSAPWSLAVFWLVLAGGECHSWRQCFRTAAARPARQGASPPALAAASDPEATPLPGTPSLESTSLAEEVSLLPPEVVQHFIRTRSPDGESIRGFARSEFHPGERSQSVHLTFCPPLAARPSLIADQLHGPRVTIRAAQVESYGARLELRLAAQSNQAESVVVGFEARLSASHGSSRDP